MTDDFQVATVLALQQLYKSNPHARQLFDWLATLKKDATATSLDRIEQILSISHKAAVALARELQNAGCGRFVVGRRGGESRFEWHYSRSVLGRVAAAQAEALEDLSEPVSEAEEVAFAAEEVLTIAKAKELLAKSLGITVDQIEIQIRA